MSENPEIIALESEISDLEKGVDALYVQIKNIRDQCNHKRVDYPEITNPWWCQKCGGEMP